MSETAQNGDVARNSHVHPIFQTTLEPFEVSSFRKVILQGSGRTMRQWAYGQQWCTPRVTPDGIRVAPHREYYSDADAAAVCEMLNGRVAS